MISSRPKSFDINTLRLAVRFSRRELRGGLRGFWIFIGCIALGVASISGVGSVAHAMRDAISANGREILGADISFALIQRRASASEQSWIQTLGVTPEIATLRALARQEPHTADTAARKPPISPLTAAPKDDTAAVSTGADQQALVEVKAVDAAYPLYGKVGVRTGSSEVFGGHSWQDFLGPEPDGAFGALMEESLVDRLKVQVGDEIALGHARIRLNGILVGEPDKLSAGIGFGPRLMISVAALDATGLVQPGSLVRWTYRVKLPADDAGSARLDAIKQEAVRRFPQAGWEIRTRNDASPGLVSNIKNFASFLTLVGLTALIVGGVGVANAVRSFVEMKRDVIAIFKCLGASGNLVFLIYGVQVFVVTLVGIVVGLLGGIGLTAIAAHFLKDLLPIEVADPVYPSELALAALYGVLTAFSFALWPLGRTHDMQPSALFRAGVAPARVWPRLRYTIATAATALILIALAVVLSPDGQLAAGYLASFAVIFAAFRLVAAGVGFLARRLPRMPSTELRLAVANLHRPGSAVVSVILSLGLGLTLLVSLSLIDTNLRAQLGAQLPKTVPSFFFLDVSPADLAPFATDIVKAAPEATFESVPMLRGRIVSVKGVAAGSLKVAQRSAFVLQGDRGMTYAATLPPNSTLTEGKWWPPNYDGPPLVSLEDDLGHDLGLHIGDKMTVNVLGRDLDVTVGNLRKVNWTNFGINFFMVFSPNTFEGAPIGNLATVAFPPGTPDSHEYQLLAEVSRAFPTITAIRVKDQLKAVDDIIGKLATGVAAAASVSILTAILVLAGAFAASQERRIYVAVILKTLGATRARILAALTLEFVALGLIAGLLALAAGSLAAWVVIGWVMGLVFLWSIGVGAMALAAALIVTLLLGLANTAVALTRKAAPALRNR